MSSDPTHILRFRFLAATAASLALLSGFAYGQDNPPPMPELPSLPAATSSETAIANDPELAEMMRKAGVTPDDAGTPPASTGVFDPAKLQAEQDQESSGTVPPPATDVTNESSAPVDDPSFPAMPALPDFTTITEPGAELPSQIGAVPAEPAVKTPDATAPETAVQTGASEITPPAIPELPELPESVPDTANVSADKLPKWLEDDTQVEALTNELPAPPAVDSEIASGLPENNAARIAQQKKDIGPISRKPPSGLGFKHNFKIAPSEQFSYRESYGVGNRHLPKARFTENLEDELFTFAANNQADKVGVLLGAGVPIEMRNAEAETPLFIAVRHNATAAAKLLLAKGADAQASDMNGVRPIHFATLLGNSELVAALLKAGADPLVPDPNGIMPLEVAEHQGNQTVIDLLRDSTGGIQHASSR